MKLKTPSLSKTARLLNLEVQKIRIRFEGLSYEVWLLTKLPPFGTGSGYGKKYLDLLLQTMKLQQFLSRLPKVSTISMTYTIRDSKTEEIIEVGDLPPMIIHIFQKQRLIKQSRN